MTWGGDRETPLSCGYIGDISSGGLVLHDRVLVDGRERDVTIDLGYGIDAQQAWELGQELDAVLRKIHYAQRRYT